MKAMRFLTACFVAGCMSKSLPETETSPLLDTQSGTRQNCFVRVEAQDPVYTNCDVQVTDSVMTVHKLNFRVKPGSAEAVRQMVGVILVHDRAVNANPAAGYHSPHCFNAGQGCWGRIPSKHVRSWTRIDLSPSAQSKLASLMERPYELKTPVCLMYERPSDRYSCKGSQEIFTLDDLMYVRGIVNIADTDTVGISVYLRRPERAYLFKFDTQRKYYLLADVREGYLEPF